MKANYGKTLKILKGLDSKIDYLHQTRKPKL